MAQMEPNLSRRNVRRLSHEYNLPEGAIREILTIGTGTNQGDVVESPGPRQGRGLRFWLPVAMIPVAVSSIYLIVAMLRS